MSHHDSLQRPQPTHVIFCVVGYLEAFKLWAMVNARASARVGQIDFSLDVHGLGFASAVLHIERHDESC